MSEQQFIDCRMCRGCRPHNGKVCLGCGTPVANARVVERKRSQPGRPPCPACGCRVSHEVAAGRFSCRDCMAEFEAVEVGYCDTRPDVNAEKRERHEKARRV